MFDVLQPIRIFESKDGILKIEPMLAAIFGSLGDIPLVAHALGRLPDTGSAGKSD